MPKFKQLKPKFKAPTKLTVRKNLTMDAMMTTANNKFIGIPEHRQQKNCKISLPDALMSGYAMFALKDPSLLAFDNRRQSDDSNFKRVFGIQHIPSDTQLREILDPVDPDLIRPIFKDIFYQLQRGKALEPLAYYQDCYLLSIDGTGSFSSEKLSSASCLEKKSKNGKITYYQQVLGAAIVHPNYREVIPLAPEMIIKQDGATKNDCERNAARRFLRKVRQDHPRLKLIVIEDGLSSNAPHIKDLQTHGMHYILGAKEGDHPLLFHTLNEAAKKGETGESTMIDEKNPKITHRFRFLNNVSLNQANRDLKVNVLEYWEVSGTKTLHFAWVTDFTITEANVHTLMRGGRARWKIENETFNTLKNQGYNFEHNYGLGKEHLSEVLVMLMMLAFLVDQTQQLTSALFKAAWEKLGTKRALWENIRNLFHSYEVDSMEMIYRAIVNGFRKSGLEVYDDA